MEALETVVDRLWEDAALPALTEYVRIPCLSPAFDADWEAAGHLAEAARFLADWCTGRLAAGGLVGSVEVVETPGRTPALWVDVAPEPPTTPGTVLVYGHLDKQPPLGEWREGFDPYEPVREGDRLYGRGTADDGYSVFAALCALEALARTGTARPRTVVLIEASEESGSPDLDAHLEDVGTRLGAPGGTGAPDLVACLDSGALTYDRLWRTTSLRGNVVATVRVDVLTEGVHSGAVGGIVPSSFRILRRLLSRIEDERTGEVLLPEMRATVPDAHRANLAALAAEFPGAYGAALPTVAGLRLAGTDGSVRDDAGTGALERLLAVSWTAALATTGMDGIPAVRDGGNVLRPFTAAKVSVRLPPSADARAAADALVRVLEADPPEGAAVHVELETPAQGWVAPDPAPWVDAALARASTRTLGRQHGACPEGGTIPFLATLGARFPTSQLVALGVLGPGSNAHGPNESLHLPMAKAVTVAVAELLGAAGGAPAAAG